MAEKQYDVIVVGAGMAGLCCAGELVLQGARPLLISEGKEVGVAVRSRMVAGNRGIMQVPAWQTGWGGGWWPNLVRRLGIPVSTPLGFGPVDFQPVIQGSFDLNFEIPQLALSAASLTEALTRVFPFLAEYQNEFTRVLGAALAIPYQDLVRMNHIPLIDWLNDQRADELVTHFMLTLGAMITSSTADFTREHISTYGALGYLRSCFCGEATFGFVYPDAREGLAVPIAREVERRGGTVWRGRKVAHISTEGGRIGHVVMQDGETVSAPHVAIACGNSRIRALLDPLPPEAEAVVDYSEPIEHRDFNIFAVLDKPVVPAADRKWIGVITPEGSMVNWMAPLHNMVPWTTLPGKQFVTVGCVLQPEEIEKHGGEEGAYARLVDLADDYYPGFKDAAEVVQNFGHQPGHLWYGNITIGPKLPQRAPSVEGLWFVGEGSEPTCGIWMEAAASGGILGARAIKAAVG